MDSEIPTGEVKRTLMQHGGSLVVALPPEWLRYNKLDKGSEVKVEYHDYLVIIEPIEENDKRRQARTMKKRVQGARDKGAF